MGMVRIVAPLVSILCLIGIPAYGASFQIGAFQQRSNALKRVSLLKQNGFQVHLEKGPSSMKRVVTPPLTSDQEERLARFLQSRNINFVVNSNEPPPETEQEISDTGVRGILEQLSHAYQIKLGPKLLNRFNSVMGTQYVWGGESLEEGGFDCSGLLYWGLEYEGMPRTVETMWDWTHRVSRNQLRPGDFIFFRFDSRKEPDHVGLYLGDGKFIHASSSYGVIKADFRKDYYQRNFYGVGRPPQ